MLTTNSSDVLVTRKMKKFICDRNPERACGEGDFPAAFDHSGVDRQRWRRFPARRSQWREMAAERARMCQQRDKFGDDVSRETKLRRFSSAWGSLWLRGIGLAGAFVEDPAMPGRIDAGAALRFILRWK